MKKQTNLTIDHELLEEAKGRQFNMSEIAENALREKLGKKQIEIETLIDHCEFCGNKGQPETITDAKNRTNRPNDLTWLYPDEKWICNACLKNFKSQIAKK